MSDFPAALDFVLQREGGLVDNPADPGGRTNFGITQRTLDDWRIRNPTAPPRVDDLTPEVVSTIYESSYWKACACDTLDQGPALALFDTAVNVGVTRALAMWQAAGNDVEEFLWARLAYYSTLVHLARFLPSWLKRVLLLRRTIHAQGGA